MQTKNFHQPKWLRKKKHLEGSLEGMKNLEPSYAADGWCYYTGEQLTSLY